MKTAYALARALAALFLAAFSTSPALADIEVRLSVKFIRNWDGTRPVNSGNIDLSTSAAFDVEVAHGNSVLAATGRGYRLTVVEYLDIQPPAPAGQASDYWYTLPARSNRQIFETAAQANMATWRWNNSGSLNIYVNNSSSGSCSFIGSGVSISMGSTIFSRGTILHEVGHFFNLSHTHAGDPDCSTFVVPAQLNTALGDGDGIVETIPDHPCFTRDQLSIANYGTSYSGLTAGQQAAVTSSWLNVMSYHQEDQFLDVQMDYWSAAANGARLPVCNGRTWFISNTGNNSLSGLRAETPFASLGRGLTAVTAPADVVLLLSGTYTAAGGTTITTPCTLRSARGAAIIIRTP